MTFAEVAVDAHTHQGRTFIYSVPHPLHVTEGDIVLVPFGKQRLQGIVFHTTETSHVSRTRDIIKVSSTEPVLSASLLKLARWISQYYMCSLFEAASHMLPPGGRQRSKMRIISATECNENQEFTVFQQAILEHIRSNGSVDQDNVIKIFGRKATASLDILETEGIVNRYLYWPKPKIGPKYDTYAKLTELGQLASAEPPWTRAPKQASLLACLSQTTESKSLSLLRREFGSAAVRATLDKGWVQEERFPVERNPLSSHYFPPYRPVDLNLDQTNAAYNIKLALDAPASTTFLLHGVTGSGKTEVYLDAANHCIETGRQVIILVPEIALTHQTVERFGSRFKGNITMLHSGLTPGERYDQWWKIKRGAYKIVIGSRSAVFAPLPNLGLIVIDEEHEWTYKQADATPRYSARDCAVQLSGITKSVVLLGDASPDIGTYRLALQGDYKLLNLPKRFPFFEPTSPSSKKQAQLATVNIIDMRQELREGNYNIFCRSLSTAMVNCISQGNQMILFLNRRGSASHVQCQNCGTPIKCRRCEVALTYHRGYKRLICHYCGANKLSNKKCSKCFGYNMNYYGIGTESVTETASKLLPGVTVVRLDSDTAKRPAAQAHILAEFASGNAQVLVGTQMIAKGFDFPNVSLVGVISADTGLNMPDHRAGERVFQLLCQVAGRAGRGESPGTVFIQTFQPENYSIRAAASQDYYSFYKQELAFRKEQANPPFTKLIRLLYQHADRGTCEREALSLTKAIKNQQASWGISDIDVLGPTPAYPTRIRGRYRWHIILRGPEPRVLLDKVTVPKRWVIDVDPVSLT